MIQYSQEFDKVYGVNNGYFIARGFRKKKKEVEDFQSNFKKIGLHFKDEYCVTDDVYFELKIYWYNPKFYKKAGGLNQSAGDIDGPLKFIIDGIFDGLGVNDARLCKLNVEKLPTKSDKHKLIIELGIGNLNNI